MKLTIVTACPGGHTTSWLAAQRLSLAAERPCAEAALVVAAKDHAHVFHGDDLLARFPTHHFNGVLVAQVVASLDRVIGVIAPVVAPVGEGGVDPSLRGVGVAPDGVDLGDDGYVNTVGPGRKGGTHAS